jgi:hypothetical protein
MKKLLFITLFIVKTTWASGPSTSGGGFAVVCRDMNQQILSSELLDLYEARTVHQFQLMPASGDDVRDYVRAVNNGYRLQGYDFGGENDQKISQNYLRFFSIVRWLPSDEKLPNLNDYGVSMNLPLGCQLEPLAIFYDEPEHVLIDKDIWQSLDSRSRAGLVIHELNYHYLRQMKINPDKNSMDARLMTASDFSLNLTPVNSGLPLPLNPKTEFYKCIKNEFSTSCAQSTRYYKISLGSPSERNNKIRIQFTEIAGRPLKSLTYLDIPQFVNFGVVYPIMSRQLIGWTAEVVQDHNRLSDTGVKLVIRKRSEFLLELSL